MDTLPAPGGKRHPHSNTHRPLRPACPFPRPHHPRSLSKKTQTRNLSISSQSHPVPTHKRERVPYSASSTRRTEKGPQPRKRHHNDKTHGPACPPLLPHMAGAGPRHHSSRGHRTYPSLQGSKGTSSQPQISWRERKPRVGG